jgi:hypothetical protein
MTSETPELSIVLIGYDMPRQLENTLYTLGAEYQRGVAQDQYEVIIVENSSSNALAEQYTRSLPANFRYFIRDENSVSPAAAINFGIAQARGRFVGLMVDGAHMLSPQVIHYALKGCKLSDDAFITVPTYHLGPQEQHLSSHAGYDEDAETRLLKSIAWQSDGYQLFTVSSWCGANPRGYLAPIMESNCYFASRQAFDAIGKADLRFQHKGGGSLNLDIVRKLGIRPNSLFITLCGEGSFHQYHGGVTSNSTRQQFVETFQAQLQDLWSDDYQFLERNPILLGSISEPAYDRLSFSSEKMLRRFGVCSKKQWPVWSDDPEED